MAGVASKHADAAAELQLNEAPGSIQQRAFWSLAHRCVSGAAMRHLMSGSFALTICSTCNLLTPYLLGSAVDAAHLSECRAFVRFLGIDNLKGHLALASGIFLLGSLASACRTELLEKAEDKIRSQLKMEAVRSWMFSSPSFFLSHPPGALASLLERDTSELAEVLAKGIPQLLRYSNSAFGGSVALLLISKRLTGTALLLLPLAGASAMFFAKRLKLLRAERQAAEAHWTQAALDRLYSHRAVYIHQQQLQEVARSESLAVETLRAAAACSRASGLLMGGISLVTNMSLLAVLVCGASLLRRDSISYGSLTSFVVYSAMVAMGFSGLASLTGEWARGYAAADRLSEALGTLGPVPLKSVRSDKPAYPDEFDPENTCGNIKFEHVTYLYGQDGARPAGDGIGGVQDVSFELRAGELLALAGASGAGKSTLLKLITKELKPQEGLITADGVDLETIPTDIWLRRVLGVVSDCTNKFFDGLTVRENLEYACGGDLNSQPQGDLNAISNKTNCSGFIERLPLGYDTKFGGEGGCAVSSGELQRLGLARVLLKQPKIVLLDEASSSLDQENERLFREALAAVMHVEGGTRSILLIAHSQPLLRSASRIVVMQQGKVSETGSYEQLMARGGTFSSLILGGKPSSATAVAAAVSSP